MATIGIVLHPERALARALAEKTEAWADLHGHRVRVAPNDVGALEDAEGSSGDHEFGSDLDLAVSFGGDGTMLRTVDQVARHDVPILGVNVGQLGYLSAIEPDELEHALERCIGGDYQVEERMLVAAQVEFAPERGAPPIPTEALNEIVLEKTPMGHTVRVAVYLDGEFFTTYAADGLIVATPTGSTAYSLSARGPIVAPDHRALILTPVSPHMLFDRALVLAPESRIRLELEGPRPGMLLADGRQVGHLSEGDAVVCTASPHRARLIRFDGSDFHRVLKSKFGLNDR